MEIQKALDELKALKIDYNLDFGIDFEKAQAEINQALQLLQTGVSESLPSDIEVGKAMSELSKIADKEAER